MYAGSYRFLCCSFIVRRWRCRHQQRRQRRRHWRLGHRCRCLRKNPAMQLEPPITHSCANVRVRASYVLLHANDDDTFENIFHSALIVQWRERSTRLHGCVDDNGFHPANMFPNTHTHTFAHARSFFAKERERVSPEMHTILLQNTHIPSTIMPNPNISICNSCISHKTLFCSCPPLHES